MLSIGLTYLFAFDLHAVEANDHAGYSPTNIQKVNFCLFPNQTVLYIILRGTIPNPQLVKL